MLLNENATEEKMMSTDSFRAMQASALEVATNYPNLPAFMLPEGECAQCHRTTKVYGVNRDLEIEPKRLLSRSFACAACLCGEASPVMTNWHDYAVATKQCFIKSVRTSTQATRYEPSTPIIGWDLYLPTPHGVVFCKDIYAARECAAFYGCKVIL